MDIVKLFTTEVVLEIFRFLVVAALLVFLLLLGRRHGLSRVSGWRLVLVGFGLLTFGSAIDITDNFSVLSKAVILGPNPVESFLEKIVGYAGGYVFCALGLIRWLTAYTDQHAELTGLRGRLEGEVAERTRELLAKAEELTAMNRELRELASYRSSVVARVSHEFRTPLTSVIGFASLIRRDLDRAWDEAGVLPGEDFVRRVHANLDIVTQESKRLLAMVEDILDMAALDRACRLWRDRQVDVGEAVDRAVVSISATFAEKPALSLDSEIEPGLPRLNLDPDRLHQVLVNLLGNAAKYSESGPVTVRARRENGSVLVSVADHGRGIPESKQKAIFELFERGECDPNAGSPIRGNGLGLAIAREIVEHYGGTISVVSAEGRGSVFTVHLPLSRTPAPGAN